jgi:hypothetical protein
MQLIYDAQIYAYSTHSTPGAAIPWSKAEEATCHKGHRYARPTIFKKKVKSEQVFFVKTAYSACLLIFMIVRHGPDDFNVMQCWRRFDFSDPCFHCFFRYCAQANLNFMEV